MSDPEYDQFNDIKNTSIGIFEGSALKSHDSVATTVLPEGVVLEFECQGCGFGRQLALEWPEVISLRNGVDPAVAFRGRQGIIRGMPMSLHHLPAEHAWQPIRQCDHCGFKSQVRIGDHEPERWLEQGRRGGFVPNEMQITQLVLAATGRVMPRPQQQQQGYPPGMVAPGLIRR